MDNMTMRGMVDDKADSPLSTCMNMLALGALSGSHSYRPESAWDAVCRMRDTVVTSDLSTRMETPVRGPRMVSLVWLWYQVTVLGEEMVQEMMQVRFTMLEVSRNISGPPRKVVSGSAECLL